ncbi:MAG: PEGA domain-containing protein [Sandaracinaceae bacterium]
MRDAMGARGGAWLTLGLCALGAMASGARAQEAADPTSSAERDAIREEARALYQTGLAEAAAERWVPALEAFRASFARVDRVRTRLNIAATLMRLGRARETITEAEAVLAGAPEAAERAQAEALLGQARAALHALMLRVRPADATVLVDGEPVDGRGTTRALRLDPGRHLLEVQAPGHRPERQTLLADAEDVQVVLEPLPGALDVRTRIEGARIVVDGEARGTDRLSTPLRPGEHDLRVEAEGHEAFVRTFDLAPGQELVIDAELLRSPEDVAESPWLWGGIGAGVVVVGAVILGVFLATAPPSYEGGSGGFVLRPE